MANDLSAVYQQIAELVTNVENGNMPYPHNLYVGRTHYNLSTLDGLFQIWDEFCKPKGWRLEKFAEHRTDGGHLFAFKHPSVATGVETDDTGNFHADFARLLAAVLKECK